MRRLAILVTAFVVAGCAVTSRVATMELPGSTWELVAMDGEAVAGDAVPTLAFDEQGAVSGSTGCNTSGDVTINGSELSIGPLVTTRMACADPAANAQEEAFLSSLERVSGYTVGDQGRLVLQGGGPELTFAVAAVGS